jgi:hypothetical protein
MMPNERFVILSDGKLIGNTKYHLKNVSDVPFKYLKWLAHSSICDQSVRDYYLTIAAENSQTSVCIHCNKQKNKSEMTPAQESWHIKGLYQNSNVCQDCYDQKLAIHSAKNIFQNIGIEIIEENIPKDFIDAKVQVTRMKRSINQKTK